jgi:hypothetical protein
MSFFMRGMSVNIPSTGTLRERIIKGSAAGYGFKDDTTDVSPSGPPTAHCKSIKIHTQGIGLLKRCEVVLKAYTQDQFNTMYSNLVRLGSSFYVEFGTASGGTESGNFTTFDFNFEMDRLGGFEVTVKGLSKGEGPGRLYDELDILNHKFTTRAKYVASYQGLNEEIETLTFFDYINYQCQKLTGQLDNWLFNGLNNPGYNENGFAELHSFTLGGQMVFIVVAEMAGLSKETPGLIHPGGIEDHNTPCNFVELQSLIRLVNRFCLQGSRFSISDSQKYCEVDIFPGMISSDPTAVVWKFSSNTYSYGTPATKTEFDVSSFFDPNKALNIFINTIFINQLIEQTKMAIMEDSNVEVEDRESGKLPMKKFFDAIFGAIRQNTGNWIDLTLDVPEDDPNTIYVVNKNMSIGSAPPSALNINVPQIGSGTSGVREIQLTGAVPSSLTAKYFGEAPDSDGTAKNAGKVGTGIVSKAEKQDPSSSDYKNALIILGESGYDEAARAGLRKLVNSRATKKFRNSEKLDPTPIPLEVTLVTNGCVGWKFGGLLKLNGLPSTIAGGGKLRWTVTEWEQKCDGVDWTTEVKCVPRILK